MTEMMKAAVLVGPEKIETKLEPVPEMKAGDIRIRVSATGVCGSDIHIVEDGQRLESEPQGRFLDGPRILRRRRRPGHE